MKRLATTFQWWLTVFGVLATLAVVYSLFFVNQSNVKQAKALLPPVYCPGSRTKVRFGPVPYNSSNQFDFYYATIGCQAVPTGTVNTPANLDQTFGTAEQQIEQLGLRPVRRPAAIDMLASYAPGVRVYPSVPGGRGAMVIDFNGNTPLLALAGLTKLSLADTSPGLSASGQTTAVDTITYLSIPQQISAGREQLRSGRAAPGLYDAWLVADRQYGLGLLHDILANCARRCSWSHVRDAAIIGRGGHPALLERQFAQRAVSGSSAQAQLIHELANE